jgi:hypothetical protein
MSIPSNSPTPSTVVVPPTGPATESHEDVIDFLADEGEDKLELEDTPKVKSSELPIETEDEGEGERLMMTFSNLNKSWRVQVKKNWNL